MTEKEIKGYMIEKIGEIKKETECDDCILFIGKDSVGKMCAGINNEENLVLCAYQVSKPLENWERTHTPDRPSF